MDCLLIFVIRLISYKLKKVVLIIDLERSELVTNDNKKIVTFHNIIILVKSVVIKNKNRYYYNIFLKKVRMKINECLYVINAIL